MVRRADCGGTECTLLGYAGRGTVTASVASAYDAFPTDFIPTTLAFGC